MEPRRRFRFLKQLSEGTFGKVYMSEMITDSNFSKVVAIKILHGKWLEHEEIVQRSRDEARVLGLINHRNIIRVEDLTSLKGKCSIIMEYLDGVDLKTLISYCREKGLLIPLKVTLDIVEAVASAMNAAYNSRPLQGGNALKLIHRDIKPSNVMLTKEGEVKVLDFGTAQAKFEDREAKTQALAFGSAAYMAPERLFGDEDRPSGDVFSLGVTFYELITCNRFGKVPPQAKRFEAEVSARLIQAEEALQRYNVDDDIKEAILAALQQLLAYNHEERPDLQELLNLMESLSAQVHDGSLRRFCREFVAPCKEECSSEDTEDDPLAGTILFEDASEAFSYSSPWEGIYSDSKEIKKEPESKKSFSSKEAVQSEEERAESTMPVVNGNRPEEQQPDSLPVEAAVDAGQESRENTPVIEQGSPQPPPQPETSSSSKWMLFAGIALLFLAVGGGGLAYLFKDKLLGSSEAEPNKPETQQVEQPVVEEKKGEPGGIQDLGNTESASEITLKIVPSGKVQVRLQSPRGTKFRYHWDGEKPLVLQNAPAGLWKTRFEGVEKPPSTTFDVPEKKKCTFTLRLNTEKSMNDIEWEGECG